MNPTPQPCKTFKELQSSSVLDRAAIVTRRDLPQIMGTEPTDTVLADTSKFRTVIAALLDPSNERTLQEALPDLTPEARAALIANAETLIMTHQVETTLSTDDYSTHSLLKCLHQVLGLTDITAEEITALETAAAKITPNLKTESDEANRQDANLLEFMEAHGGLEFALAYMANTCLEQSTFGKMASNWEEAIKQAYGETAAYKEVKSVCEKYSDIKMMANNLTYLFVRDRLTAAQDDIPPVEIFERNLSPAQLSRIQTVVAFLLSQNYVFNPNVEVPIKKPLENGRHLYTTIRQPKWQKAKVV